MIADIARGLENYPIPVVACDYAFPAFQYIKTSVVYKAAKIDEDLSNLPHGAFCKCKATGDCLIYPWCDCAARGKNWKFAYTVEGTLRDAFFQAKLKESEIGFLVGDCECMDLRHMGGDEPCTSQRPLFISECNVKCGCGVDCGNRVVQRGMRWKVEVFHTGRTGWGVRTQERIPKGAYVFELTGEILTNEEAMVRNEEAEDGATDYSVAVDADWALEEAADDTTALNVDASRFGNVARFLNHR
jgi:hypothetical protein